MKVAITGGTGFIGRHLVQRLQQDGHGVVVLARNASKARRLFPEITIVPYTPLALGDWQQSLEGCDGVVNLAGTPIAERWTPAYKQQLRESRITTTQILVEAIAAANPKPSVLVSASAIGYYGTSETAVFDELSIPMATDFLSQLCQDWEAAAKGVEATGVRLVIPRIGIVLGQGGALGRMLTPFRMFAGGPIGSGRQWFSWIALTDLTSLLIQALTDKQMQGTYNATAPHPVTMATACEALGQALNRPSWLPVPDFVIETLLGDAAVVVLKGQKVLPRRTQATGFTYQYPQVTDAMKAVVT
ncbi:MAG: TIGR01777 family oxidoreductase [Cyanobacteria bacterium]|nr:TIGR01777 family oxidoreductase [Cyanobacteriota bacterium]